MSPDGGRLYVADCGYGAPGAVYRLDMVVTVLVDVKPGSVPNSVNPGSKGVIPVAILTMPDFDAATVDPASFRFGRTGTEAAPQRWALEDVDGDSDLDLILQFDTQQTGIRCGDSTALLKGLTQGGQPLEGADTIRTVSCR